MSATPEVTISIASRRRSLLPPQRLLRKIAGRPPEEIGYWDGKTSVQLSVESYPDSLTASARGSFPRLEESLQKRSQQIPKHWQVQHMLACLIVAGVGVLESVLSEDAEKQKKEHQTGPSVYHPVDFDTHPPSVNLIIDPYFKKRTGYDIAVHFQVVTGGRKFSGRINTPQYQIYAAKQQYQTCVGIPVVSTKLGQWEKGLSVSDFIRTDDYATVLFDQLVDFTAATIETSKQNRLTRLWGRIKG